MQSARLNRSGVAGLPSLSGGGATAAELAAGVQSRTRSGAGDLLTSR